MNVEEGNQIVTAWYMRDSIHNFVGTPSTEYAKYSNVKLSDPVEKQWLTDHIHRLVWVWTVIILSGFCMHWVGILAVLDVDPRWMYHMGIDPDAYPRSTRWALYRLLHHSKGSKSALGIKGMQWVCSEAQKGDDAPEECSDVQRIKKNMVDLLLSPSTVGASGGAETCAIVRIMQRNTHQWTLEDKDRTCGGQATDPSKAH
ncbi:hypothetical protein BDR03DRAFT_986783 [Suillus americanus]|nr:hypothetical protein BDR03DRAFT_986783 [Suillus americanus]